MLNLIKNKLDTVHIDDNYIVDDVNNKYVEDIIEYFLEKNYCLGEEFEEVIIDFDSLINEYKIQKEFMIDYLIVDFILKVNKKKIGNFEEIIEKMQPLDYDSKIKLLISFINKRNYKVKIKVVLFCCDASNDDLFEEFLKIMSRLDNQKINFLAVATFALVNIKENFVNISPKK